MDDLNEISEEFEVVKEANEIVSFTEESTSHVLHYDHLENFELVKQSVDIMENTSENKPVNTHIKDIEEVMTADAHFKKEQQIEDLKNDLIKKNMAVIQSKQAVEIEQLRQELILKNQEIMLLKQTVEMEQLRKELALRDRETMLLKQDLELMQIERKDVECQKVRTALMENISSQQKKCSMSDSTDIDPAKSMKLFEMKIAYFNSRLKYLEEQTIYNNDLMNSSNMRKNRIQTPRNPCSAICKGLFVTLPKTYLRNRRFCSLPHKIVDAAPKTTLAPPAVLFDSVCKSTSASAKFPGDLTTVSSTCGTFCMAPTSVSSTCSTFCTAPDTTSGTRVIIDGAPSTPLGTHNILEITPTTVPTTRNVIKTTHTTESDTCGVFETAPTVTSVTYSTFTTAATTACDIFETVPKSVSSILETAPTIVLGPRSIFEKAPATASDARNASEAAATTISVTRSMFETAPSTTSIACNTFSTAFTTAPNTSNIFKTAPTTVSGTHRIFEIAPSIVTGTRCMFNTASKTSSNARGIFNTASTLNANKTGSGLFNSVPKTTLATRDLCNTAVITAPSTRTSSIFDAASTTASATSTGCGLTSVTKTALASGSVTSTASQNIDSRESLPTCSYETGGMDIDFNRSATAENTCIKEHENMKSVQEILVSLQTREADIEKRQSDLTHSVMVNNRGTFPTENDANRPWQFTESNSAHSIFAPKNTTSNIFFPQNITNTGAAFTSMKSNINSIGAIIKAPIMFATRQARNVSCESNVIKFSPVRCWDWAKDHSGMVTCVHQCICIMPEYEKNSMEELRLQDYRDRRKPAANWWELLNKQTGRPAGYTPVSQYPLLFG